MVRPYQRLAPLVAEKIKGPVGDYTARKIVNSIKNPGRFRRRTREGEPGMNNSGVKVYIFPLTAHGCGNRNEANR